MFDVNASLIRYWCTKFKVLNPKRTGKGNRVFTQADVETLKLIHHLVKEKGMTLKGADSVLKEHLNTKKDVSKQMTVLERLQNMKAILLDIRLNLQNKDDSVYDASEDETNDMS